MKTKTNRTTRSAKTTNSKTAKATKVSVKSTNQSNRRDRSAESIKNGIEIVKSAIDNNASVSATAKQRGFGRNYISDIKARLETNLKENNIGKTQYTTFKSLINKYNKAGK